ncbi:hypothetical protein HZH68_003293 [Vespula germanica]|uniref:Uncharacterized protein n=1 Tax=Vespula germanica TaxID=30212 RepID=A0A834NP00_VESGE|nr:hypothetical protein HZH68_003293 [Vespula germanica]
MGGSHVDSRIGEEEDEKEAKKVEDEEEEEEELRGNAAGSIERMRVFRYYLAQHPSVDPCAVLHDHSTKLSLEDYVTEVLLVKLPLRRQLLYSYSRDFLAIVLGHLENIP